MPDFYVNVICEECGEKHSAQIRVFLADGPSEEMSIADAFKEEELSDSINSLLENTICVCPKSGNNFKQTDPQKVYLRQQVYGDPPGETDTEDDRQHAAAGKDNFLEALAREFMKQPEIPQTERVNIASALRTMANRPRSVQIVKEVLCTMLFTKN